MNEQTSSNRVVIILAVLLMAMGVARSWQIANVPTAGIDFLHFWAVPKTRGIKQDPAIQPYNRAHHAQFFESLKSSAEEINSLRLNHWLVENQERYRSGLHPTGTPFLYATNNCLQTENVDHSYWVFQWFSIALFVLGCVLLGHRFGWTPVHGLIAAGALLLFHRGVQSDIGVANVNRIQFGCFCIAVWRLMAKRGPEWLRFASFGLLMSILVAYKPNVAVALLLPTLGLIIDRRFQSVVALIAGCLVGGAIGFLGAALLRDHAILALWQEWLVYIRTITDAPFALIDGNYSLARLVNDHLVGNVSMALTVLLLLAASAWVFVNGEKDDTVSNQTLTSNPARYALLAGIGLVIPLVSAPVTWGHYLVLSLPLAFMLLQRTPLAHLEHLGHKAHRTTGLVVVAIVLTGLLPVTLIPGVPAVVVLLSIQAGLLMLFVAGLHLLR